MALTSFTGAKGERSGGARTDPAPGSPGERKGPLATISRLFPGSSNAGTRGGSSASDSGGGSGFPRILLIAGLSILGIVVLGGLVFLATNVLRSGVVSGPVAVVEQDGSTDRAAPPIAISEGSEAIGSDKQGAAAGSKNAQAPGPEVEASNDWILPLTARQISRYYPERALQKGVEGAVTLRCSFKSRRAPDCTVLRERPDGWRFGSAARRLSRQFEPTSQAVTGEPFNVTVRFRLER